MKFAGLGPSDMTDADRPERARPEAVAGRVVDATSDRAGAPFAVRARVTITPWTDLAFARDVREVMRMVSLSEAIVLGSGTGAVLAERLLRERGYGHARVIDARSPDEALRRVAHWRVLRDGERTTIEA